MSCVLSHVDDQNSCVPENMSCIRYTKIDTTTRPTSSPHTLLSLRTSIRRLGRAMSTLPESVVEKREAGSPGSRSPKRARLDADGNDATDSGDSTKQPKRKVACIIGYCGTGYSGLQINPGTKTIEGAFFDAFVAAGAVSADNSDDPRKVSLQRCARTDKGVHAAVNILSMKMIVGDPEIVQKINGHLPDQLRLWKVVRTPKSFNPRLNCDSRQYEYLIPTLSFIPPRSNTAFGRRICPEHGLYPVLDAAKDFWADHTWTATSTEPDELRRSRAAVHTARRQFRISPERLAVVRDSLRHFVGTKNFHNYTVDQDFKDASSKRIIRSFVASEPFLIDGTEWISLKIHGQSFMLHQIRKMVAMLVLIVRCGVSDAQVAKTFGPTRVAIPKAPSLGLLLERPLFESFNAHLTRQAGEREALTVDELNAEIESFKQQHIYDKLYAAEQSENVYTNFTSTLDGHGAAGNLEFLFGDVPITTPVDVSAQGSVEVSAATNGAVQPPAELEEEQVQVQVLPTESGGTVQSGELVVAAAETSAAGDEAAVSAKEAPATTDTTNTISKDT